MDSSPKLNTLSKSIFSCWPLFVPEDAFLFFEFFCGGLFFCLINICSFCCYLLLSFCCCSCCCLSSLALLVLEIVRDRLFPCFWCLLVGPIDLSLSCMLGLILLLKLVVMLRPLEWLWLFKAFLCFHFFRQLLLLFAPLVYVSSC